MPKLVLEDKCSKECTGFTGELWNPKNRDDLYICSVSGYVGRPFYMPSPHAVEIGMKCKFKG